MAWRRPRRAGLRTAPAVSVGRRLQQLLSCLAAGRDALGRCELQLGSSSLAVVGWQLLVGSWPKKKKNGTAKTQPRWLGPLTVVEERIGAVA